MWYLDVDLRGDHTVESKKKNSVQLQYALYRVVLRKKKKTSLIQVTWAQIFFFLLGGIGVSCVVGSGRWPAGYDDVDTGIDSHDSALMKIYRRGRNQDIGFVCINY